MNRLLHLTIFSLVLILTLMIPNTAEAAGFGEYEGGILKIELPRTIRIYKKGSGTSKSIQIGSSEYTIRDARWQGAEIVVTLTERSGKQTIRVYKDTSAYRIVH